jgi:hypothetical protein
MQLVVLMTDEASRAKRIDAQRECLAQHYTQAKVYAPLLDVLRSG